MAASRRTNRERREKGRNQRMDRGAVKLAPSILAADFGRLGDQVAEAERAGVHRSATFYSHALDPAALEGARLGVWRDGSAAWGQPRRPGVAAPVPSAPRTGAMFAASRAVLAR